MLMKSSELGDSEVGVIFGYLDDRVGCNELANLHNSKFPTAEYYCLPLN